MQDRYGLTAGDRGLQKTPAEQAWPLKQASATENNAVTRSTQTPLPYHAVR
jgi:hypothetical protein